MWAGDKLAKGTVRGGEAEMLLICWRHVILLINVVLVFRSETAKESWKEIHKLVEELMKRFTK